MNIPDEMFWNADIKFLDKVVNQKAAYDKWLSKAMQKESER
jgi:hypothetical protein